MGSGGEPAIRGPAVADDHAGEVGAEQIGGLRIAASAPSGHAPDSSPVDAARGLAQVGHDEAWVVPRRAAGEPHDFGLDHHAARASPRARAVAQVSR